MEVGTVIGLSDQVTEISREIKQKSIKCLGEFNLEHLNLKFHRNLENVYETVKKEKFICFICFVSSFGCSISEVYVIQQ